MVALSRFSMADLARQKRLEVELTGAGDLTPEHSVGQAVEHYLDRQQVRDNGLRWTAFSRGVMLDSKRRLGELESTDTEWTVMPEVSAGRPG
jgi:hypothetical protein